MENHSFFLSTLSILVDLITIDKVRCVFQQHGCPQGEDPLLNCRDLNEILQDLFTGCKHARLDDTTRIRSVDLIQNFVLNLYDRYDNLIPFIFSFSVTAVNPSHCVGHWRCQNTLKYINSFMVKIEAKEVRKILLPKWCQADPPDTFIVDWLLPNENIVACSFFSSYCLRSGVYVDIWYNGTQL